MKKIIKGISGLLIAVMTCFVIFSTTGLFTMSSHAGSPVGYLDSKKTSQSYTIVIDNAVESGDGKSVYYLYPNGNDVSSIKNAFSYYVSNATAAGNNSSDSELIHQKNSSSTLVNNNGQFVSLLNLSSNMIIALNEGYVSLEASAYFTSGNAVWASINKDKNDKPESVEMAFYAYNDSLNVNQKVSGERDNYLQNADVLSFNSAELKGNNFDKIELSFTSSYVTPSGWATTANFMKVKQPMVTVSTTDITKPNMSVSTTSEWTNVSRPFTFSVSDAESGISKIQVSTDGTNWTNIFEFSSYETSAERYYEIEENGTYYFRTLDNVGNVSNVYTHTESKIDKIVPEIEISISDLFTEKTVSFDATISGTGISNDNFFFTYSESGVTSDNISFVNGTNTFIVPENGTYTFDFFVVDEAGNECHKTFENIVVDDTNYNLQIVGYNCDANLNGQTSNIVKRGIYNLSFTSNNETIFSQIKITTNGVTNILSESEIKFASSANSNGEFSINITGDTVVEVYYKKIINLNIQTEYTYDATGFKISYVANANIDENLIIFEYCDKDNNLIKNPVNLDIGEYYVRYSILENELFVGDGSAQIVVYKKELSITLNTTEYEYSGSIQNLDLTLSEDVDIVIEILKNNEIANFENIGEYVYKITCDNNNYFLSGNIAGTVIMKRHNIVVSVNETNFVYDKTTHLLDFSIDTNLVDKNDIVVKYYTKSNYEAGNLVETLPENAGEYVAVFCFDNDNFTLEKVIDVVVAKRKVSVYALPQTITYGDETPNFEYYYTGNVEGDELSFNIISNLSINDLGLVNAGSYELSFENVEFENYEVELYKSELFIVNKKSITITPFAVSKMYGEADPTFEYSVTGLVSGDSLNGKLSRLSEEIQNVGHYNITLGTIENSNYDISLDVVLFEIQKRPAVIVLKNSTKVYGTETPKFDFYIEGSNVLPQDVEYIISSISCENANRVGTFNITVDIEKVQNYNVISINAKLTVLPAKLTITANAQNKVYGEADPTFTYSVSGLVAGDTISGNLSREMGENVGEYQIALGSLSAENYEIEFVSASLKITPATLFIVANTQSKVYGEADPALTYSVSGLVSGDEIGGELLRVQGENVGEYQITLGSLSAENYVISYTSSNLEIRKSQITITFDDKTRAYGETNPDFTYSVLGIVSGEVNVLSFDVACNAEIWSNVSSYTISANNIKVNSANYEENVIVNCGTLHVEKADLDLVLSDKTVVYSGNEVQIDMPNMDLNFEFVYSNIMGTVESVVDAGTYNVYFTFAGNENYNAYKSNTAVLTVNRKIVPVMVKKSIFLYNGNQQSPVYEIGLDEDISLIVKYENDVYPVELGEYNYTIESNDPNYYCSFKGTIKIVSELYIENNNGSASITTDNVNYSSSEIQIYEDASLLSTFSSFNDGLKCVTAYGFKNVDGNYIAGDVFTFKIRALNTNESVKIYAIDRNGKISEISYTIDNGYYVLSINDLSVSILVTNTDRTMLYAKIGSIVGILLLCVIVTKSINRYRRNRFFKKNTVYKNLDKKLLKESENIVNSRINVSKKISGVDFVDKKYWFYKKI